MRRRLVALSAGVAAAVGLAIAVPPSSASWIDQEWIAASLDSGQCGTTAFVDTNAWSAFLAGDQGGVPLADAPALGALAVENLAPATASSGSSTATASSLGSDAWSTTLPLTGLAGLDLGGTALPFGPSTGSVTQFGRATAAGVAASAAGAVALGSDGVAALELPGATARSLDLSLDALLAPTLAALGNPPDRLTDLRVSVGSSGAIAGLDACDPLWNGLDPVDSATRDYLIDDLDISFRSDAITGFADAVRSSLTSLEATLDAIRPPGTPVTGSALTTITASLTTALNFSLFGIGNSLASVNSVTAGVDVELDPAIALVTGSLSDGVVSIDLGTGELTADFDALWDIAEGGGTGLNARPANSELFTLPVITELNDRVRALLTDFVTGVVRPAVLAAIDDATVTTVVDVTLRNQLLFINLAGVRLESTITGTVEGYQTGSPAPTVSSVASETSTNILGAILSLIGMGLPSLLNAIENSVEAPLVATTVPAVASSVVTPWKASAAAAVTPWASGLTGMTLGLTMSQLSVPIAAIWGRVPIVVNAQPDAAGAVGSPIAEEPGRVIQSALALRVLDAAGDPVATIFVASAAVGPATLR